MTDPTVLYIDPDADSRERTGAALERALDVGSVATARTPAEALDLFDPEGTHAVVSRYSFPEVEVDGLDLLSSIADHGPETVAVLYADTAVDDLETARVDGVVAEYVPDGATDALVRSVERALADRSHAAHPLPDDEAARLDALDSYPLSDPTLLESLDRLTAIASDLFDATFVNVHVLSRSRQQSLACRGPSRLDTDRKDSVCTYAILSEGVTVVEDLSADPRFAEQSYVDAYDLDWYVGVPVVVPPGTAVGTVCLLGSGPLSLTEADRENLERFAAEAADQFELARLRTDEVRSDSVAQ